VSGMALNVETFGPEFRRWVHALEALGGCSAPVMLMGHTITRDRATGEVVHVFKSEDLPFGLLMVPCRNRRQTVCLPCSLLHNGDSFAIVRAGLSGGKGVPEEVSGHPRAFVTVTAPSFGAVHRATDGGLCTPRRDEPVCPHGRPLSCRASHRKGDLPVGSPLCAECYDYRGAVAWNASAGLLWRQYIKHLGREVAKLGGLTVRTNEIRNHLRITYTKVAEFQRRGSIHFHAVIRLDGPDGFTDEPPSWADAQLLIAAAKAAGPKARMSVPAPGGGTRMIGFGAQLDAREITPGGGDSGSLSDTAVGSYIAKYVTKGDGGGLVLDRRLSYPGWIERAALTDHAKRLMRAAWDLGGMDEFSGLNLRAWAHQLGFRGNIVTKSPGYSTTYGALRSARSRFARQAAGQVEPDPEATVRESRWSFVGAGLSPELGEIAAGIAEGTRIRKGPRPDWLDAEPGDAT